MIYIEMNDIDYDHLSLSGFDPKKWRFRFHFNKDLSCYLGFNVLGRGYGSITLSPNLNGILKNQKPSLYDAYNAVTTTSVPYVGPKSQFLGMAFGGKKRELRGGKTYLPNKGELGKVVEAVNRQTNHSIPMFTDAENMAEAIVRDCKPVIDHFYELCTTEFRTIETIKGFHEWYVKQPYCDGHQGKVVNLYLQSKILNRDEFSKIECSTPSQVKYKDYFLKHY